MIPAGKKGASGGDVSKMEIRFLTKEKKIGRMSFLIKDSNPAFVNAIRRCIINEVPAMAIEDVEIRKNNSILYDEMIAHRLGLIPFKTDLKSYTPIQNCTCEGAGCAKCTLKLTLKAKGPAVITAKELQSMDPKVVPVYPDMPITKLLKGQQLELEATAVLGKGRDHMKWSPGLAYYKYKPVVDILKNPRRAEELAKRCPVDVFDYKSGKLSINKDNHLNCILCGECADLAEGDIKLNESNEEFMFFVESFGQLSHRQMIDEAATILHDQLEEFASKIKQ